MKTAHLIIVVYMAVFLWWLLLQSSILVPTRPIPAGSVVQGSDLTKSDVWTFVTFGDYALQRSQVVGHKALKPLPIGHHIHKSEVSR